MKKNVFLLMGLLSSSGMAATSNQSNMALTIGYTLTSGTCQYDASSIDFNFGNVTESDTGGSGIALERSLSLTGCNRSDDSMSSKPMYAMHTLFIQNAGGENIDTEVGIPLGAESTATGLLLQLSTKNTSGNTAWFRTSGMQFTALPNPLVLTANLSKTPSGPSSGGVINAQAWLVIQYN